MSNGYLLAAEADLASVRDIGEGFGLEVIGATTLGDHEATAATLASAANVGIVVSSAAAADTAYVALLQALSTRLARAQLLLADAHARAVFQFIPGAWPAMTVDEARMRANAMAQQRQPAPVEQPPAPAPEPIPEPEQAAPEPPVSEHAAEEKSTTDQNGAPLEDALSDDVVTSDSEEERSESFTGGAPDEDATAPPTNDKPQTAEPPWAEGPISRAGESADSSDEVARSITLPDEPPPAPSNDPPWAEGPISRAGPPADELPSSSPSQADEPVAAAPPPQSAEPPWAQGPISRAGAAAPPPMTGAPAPAPSAPPQAKAPPSRSRDESFGTPVDMHSTTQRSPLDRLSETAAADATAFAPKKLRRATPELVRIVIHQPKDLNAVIKAARKIDKRAEPAPQGMSIGEVALGASVGVSLEVRGASCDGTVQRRTWLGEPIDFSFSVEADQNVKQAVILARVFVDDAQIGILAFTRNITGPSKKPASDGDRVRLKRHKRVFLSYSSKDREVVSAIATAYARAGVEHFWDRASLKSGEEWSPRLRKEIERADLFHLCWSKSAATSEWVQKEAEHALTRRKRNSGKPEITVQMLDGPPWAAHPASLDSINFDDFVRAAIVGYARGEAD